MLDSLYRELISGCVKFSRMHLPAISMMVIGDVQATSSFFLSTLRMSTVKIARAHIGKLVAFMARVIPIV